MEWNRQSRKGLIPIWLIDLQETCQVIQWEKENSFYQMVLKQLDLISKKLTSPVISHHV